MRHVSYMDESPHICVYVTSHACACHVSRASHVSRMCESCLISALALPSLTFDTSPVYVRESLTYAHTEQVCVHTHTHRTGVCSCSLSHTHTHTHTNCRVSHIQARQVMSHVCVSRVSYLRFPSVAYTGEVSKRHLEAWRRVMSHM